MIGPNGSRGRVGLPREAVRLSIAAALLLIGGVSSALTGVPHSGAAADPAHSLSRSRFFRADLNPARLGRAPERATAAELAQRDHAFRVLAGVAGEAAEPAGVAGGREPLASLSATAVYDAPADLRTVVQRARRVSFTWRAAEESVLEERERLATTPSIAPANGYISSGFTRARAHPILALRRPHRGLDIVAPYGSPIVAAAKGRVSFVGYEGAYGLTVEIDHGRGLMTRYAHASRALVRRGQLVARGDTIARVGRTGLADGPHLHYEVLVNGEPRNPRRYIHNPNTIPD